MPVVEPSQLFRGAPFLLLETGPRHSLGWQDSRRAGPSFVVVRLGDLGSVRVRERFPLTEQGWVSAWLALCRRDAPAAAAVEARLERREADKRTTAALAALDAETVRCLPSLTFTGGSAAVPLTKDYAYDLRFMPDRVTVCRQGSAAAIVEVPYREIEAAEVSGAGLISRPSSEVIMWLCGAGLLGAFLGFLLVHPRVLGLFLGAVVFALFEGLIAGSSPAKIETIVRIRQRDAELNFLHNRKRPDALRVELSEPLIAIANAKDTQAGGAGQPAEPAPGSITEQLATLASMLQQGLITRDEFEHLKAQLITKP
jgi:hypothetical protein